MDTEQNQRQCVARLVLLRVGVPPRGHTLPWLPKTFVRPEPLLQLAFGRRAMGRALFATTCEPMFEFFDRAGTTKAPGLVFRRTT